jgi:hypothetical protein
MKDVNKENLIVLASEGLTILQQRFAEKLFTMEHPNQRQAYIDAGGTARGASADVQACRLLKNDKVKAYLNYLREKSQKKAEKTVDDAIAELARIAFKDIDDDLTYSHKLTALKEFLDRLQGKPKQQVDVKGVILSRELTPEQVKDLMTDDILPDDELDKAIAR